MKRGRSTEADYSNRRHLTVTYMAGYWCIGSFRDSPAAEQRLLIGRDPLT